MSGYANGAKSCIAHTLGGDEPSDYWYEQASEILDDLAANGYAVIELPKPTGVNGQDNRVWNDGRTTHYVEQELNGDVVINDRQHVAADELVHLGAVLLAADAQARS